SRIDAGLQLDRQDCDLVELAETERRRITLLSPGLEIRLAGVPRLVADVDPVRIAQVLANLGDNARRHTPTGGVITVDVASHGGAAVISVTDSGPGVPDDQRENIFDRLVRLEDARTRDHGGAGLGLSIARALARAHGGELTCPPHHPGARFVLELPLRAR
ncbi:MAG: two component regulator - sensor kinase, partial [Mycobacterium sp.]|nr:two component regulator - sensor kinase [Mycobacterium sp.]